MITGDLPPVNLEEVKAKADLCVGGGVNYSTPSTIVDLVNRKVVRQGAILNEITSELGKFGD